MTPLTDILAYNMRLRDERTNDKINPGWKIPEPLTQPHYRIPTMGNFCL